MDRAFLYSFMAKCRYGVVSSVAPNGTAQSALLGIAVSPQLEIIFDTLSSSRKYRNLTERPVCSFVVGWSGQQTVQYEGIASKPTGSDLKRCQEMYFATWPDGPARMSWPEIAYFVVRSTWIRYSCFDQNPPLIEETAFP
jgi:pyridoxamine 5'-phosphate oxidase-like protein